MNNYNCGGWQIFLQSVFLINCTSDSIYFHTALFWRLFKTSCFHSQQNIIVLRFRNYILKCEVLSETKVRVWLFTTQLQAYFTGERKRQIKRGKFHWGETRWSIFEGKCCATHPFSSITSLPSRPHMKLPVSQLYEYQIMSTLCCIWVRTTKCFQPTAEHKFSGENSGTSTKCVVRKSIFFLFFLSACSAQGQADNWRRCNQGKM